MVWPMGNPLGIGASEQYRVAPITYRPTVISATPAMSGGFASQRAVCVGANTGRDQDSFDNSAFA